MRRAPALPLLLTLLLTVPPGAVRAQQPVAHADLTLADAGMDAEAEAASTAAASAAASAQEEHLYREALSALADGRPNEASDMLTRILEKNAQHAGAWLDLAISQCEMGNGAEAERLFLSIEQRFAPPPGILQLIQDYRAQGCNVMPARRHALSFKTGRGHDSNVNQGNRNPYFTYSDGTQLPLSSDALPQADYYSTISADYSGPLGKAGTIALAQLRVLRHDSVHQQNTSSLLFGVEQPWRLGAWRGRATAVAGMVQLNDQLYQRQAQFQLRVTPPLMLPKNLDWAVLTGVSVVKYPSRSEYNASTLDLGTSLGYRGKLADVVFSLGALADHGGENRPGGNRDGWYGGLQAYVPLGQRISGEIGVSNQHWRGDSFYAPGIDILRRQDTRQLRAAVQFSLTPRSALLFEWRQVWNKDNISLYQYNSRAFQLSWRADTW